MANCSDVIFFVVQITSSKTHTYAHMYKYYYYYYYNPGTYTHSMCVYTILNIYMVPIYSLLDVCIYPFCSMIIVRMVESAIRVIFRDWCTLNITFYIHIGNLYVQRLTVLYKTARVNTAHTRIIIYFFSHRIFPVYTWALHLRGIYAITLILTLNTYYS